MGGFRDLLAWLLGWKSSSPVWLSYRVVAGRVFVGGAESGPSRPAGTIHSSGPVAGQIHG